MYCTPEVTLTARKRHVCTNCAQAIEPGEQYIRWMSVEDSAYTNKMHPECLESLVESEGHDFEYMPYSGERPEKAPTP